jgi:hypothetical protein
MLIPSRFSNRCATSRTAGLGRTETLWILILSVAVVFTILGTLNADRRGRDLRETQDGLRYLAGQISFALSRDPSVGESWPDALHGEGKLPEGLSESQALSSVLPAHVFVPDDPHGRAYSLRRTGPRAWVLAAADPDGRLFALDQADTIRAARDAEMAIDIRFP